MRSFPRAFVKKFPGFKQFSGYKHLRHVVSDVLISMKQLRGIMDEIFYQMPYLKEQYNKALIDFPKSSYNIPKTTLLIKLKPGSTKQQRSQLKNDMLNFSGDDSLIVFDGVTFMEDIEERMRMLDFFNIAISLVCFALGFF